MIRWDLMVPADVRYSNSLNANDFYKPYLTMSANLGQF